MAGASIISSTVIILITCSFVCWSEAQRQAYVVYMGSFVGMAKGYLRYSHLQMLVSVVGSSKVANKSLIYSYTRSFNGFSAFLSEQQAQVIASMPGVVSVFPNRMHKLHTTRSWDFLRLQADYAEGSHESILHPPVTNDVIIGRLDTGVWPELESFNDEGMGPIPSKWKGKCMEGENFNSSNCNRKLIGARYYGDGFSMSMDPEANFPIYDGPSTNDINDLPRSIRTYGSARDSMGHGSHTSTTAGGRLVDNASYYGLAKEVAKGRAPLSRIAAYKVCSEIGC